MTELEVRKPGEVTIKGPPGSRPLGVRVKPALRLAIGYRDEAKRGAPVKVDHFIAKPGPEGEYARAAAKFHDQYGEKPKAIEIRLPDELSVALDIRYKAFAGAGDDGGGVMIAKGETNFASGDWVGGPDVLTVWRQDGTVEQVETLGIDAVTGEPLDELARELGLALYTTFRFGIPSVLGYGSFCEITSKGKTTTDSLWLKLRGWYSTFGPRTAWVIRPTLFVRPATARPVVKKRGEAPKRIKTRIYALDLVLNEDEDQLLARLREHAALTREVTGSLWSGKIAPDEIAVGEVIDDDYMNEPELNAEEVEFEPLHPDEVAVAGAVGDFTAPEPTLDDQLTLNAKEKARLAAAEEVKPPHGSYQSYSLKRILGFGDSGREWLGYALRQSWPQSRTFKNDLVIFCKAHVPDIYTAYLAEGGE